jgi:serralysin
VSGGEEDVFGSASGDVVGSGGLEIVESGGTASGATVGSGGTLDVLDGGTLSGAIVDNGTVDFDIAGSAAFSGALTGAGTLTVSGGGNLDVVSAYTGAAQIDDSSALEFTSTYVGVLTFSGSSTGPGGTLDLDVPSTGPITVVNSNDTVIAQPGGNSWINAIVSYTLPTNIDALFLYAGTQGTGNSDASGDALYALNGGAAQTLTGNSPNDTFVVSNASDVVVPKAGSHDVVYAAASYTLPTGVDALILEGTAAQGVGNSDAAGDGLYAANPGQVATLTGNSPNDTFVVYNSADIVVPKAGSHDVVYSAVNYTLPTGVDILILEGSATQGVGNSDAAGDALYAANPGQVATLTGNSANDTFVVYNSADVVVPKAGSHDIVYAAVNYTLPTGVDSLILEAGTQAIGNSDAVGDTLYAANAGIAQTLTGHSHNDTFVVYNSADTVIGQASSTDKIYAAASFTLPTNVDTLFLEGNASLGTGNSDANDLLFGNAGVASTLVAGSGADLLVVAGTAGTIMTGGAGHDTFAFPNVMGKDEVTNFGLAKDTLQFNATLFSNFTAAMNAASQSGANTVFTIDANDTVTLDNVAKTSLTSSNFHFS